MTAALPLELLPFGYITPSSDGSFTFAEPGAGEPVLLLQVYGADGDLVDVVAWAWGQPSRWWLWQQAVTYIGEAEIERHRGRYPSRPLRMVETPAAWLRDGGHAFCVLDWSMPVLPLLHDLGDVACETPALERKLRSIASREAIAQVKIRGAA